MSDYSRSQSLYAEAEEVLAGGVSSNFRYGTLPVPMFIERGAGSRLFDVDGNEYIDYGLANGPIILGHAPEPVLSLVAETLGQGQLYAAQHAREIELARLMCEHVPCAELVRFSCSGSEAVHAALRVARAHTGRPKVVKFEGHYHGWFDDVFVSVAPALNAAGPANEPVAVPMTAGQSVGAYDDVVVLPWNDLDAFAAGLERHKDQVAAVIMEPILCNTGTILPRPGYLEGVRELCDAHGVVLIFDEVIMGFRAGLGGAQARLGVIPDLAIFAKAMAAGFPLSALAGKREIMAEFGPGGVMHGGTYNANVMCIAAGVATIRELAKDGGSGYDEMERLGRRIMAELPGMAARHGFKLHVSGIGAAFHSAFFDGDPAEIVDYRSFTRTDAVKRTRFVYLLQDEGVRLLSRGSWFLSTAHDDGDVDETLERTERAFARLAAEG